MKVRDVLRGLLIPYEVEDEAIDSICFMNDVDADSDVENKKQIGKLAVELLLQMYPLTGVGEGGVSLSYSVEGVRNKVYFLCRKFGLSPSLFLEPKAKITRLS